MLNEFELKNLIAKGANNHIYFLFGDDPYLVKTYADKIIKEDLSVRQTEKLVSDLLNSKPKKEENKKNKCYKNVIIFQKGVAICKQVCYNTVTYKR